MVAANMLLQTVMAGCLAQVWGMIAGLQLIVHFPAINLAFPENAMMVVKEILKIALFDIPYVDTASISEPVIGSSLLPPVDDSILTDYPAGTENF